MTYFTGTKLTRRIKMWQLEELVDLMNQAVEHPEAWPGPCTITAEDEGQVEQLRNVLYSILNHYGLKMEYTVKRVMSDLVLDKVTSTAKQSRLVRFNQQYNAPTQSYRSDPGDVLGDENLQSVFSDEKPDWLVEAEAKRAKQTGKGEQEND